MTRGCTVIVRYRKFETPEGVFHIRLGTWAKRAKEGKKVYHGHQDSYLSSSGLKLILSNKFIQTTKVVHLTHLQLWERWPIVDVNLRFGLLEIPKKIALWSVFWDKLPFLGRELFFTENDINHTLESRFLVNSHFWRILVEKKFFGKFSEKLTAEFVLGSFRIFCPLFVMYLRKQI